MPNLVSYYEEYGPSRFCRNGEPVKKRALQLIAKQYRLPVIRVGHTCLIDPEEADNRLRELALHLEQPRRRGRPRAIAPLPRREGSSL